MSVAFSPDGTKLMEKLPFSYSDSEINFFCKFTFSFKKRFSSKNMIIENSIISQFNETILRQSNAIFINNNELKE